MAVAPPPTNVLLKSMPGLKGVCDASVLVSAPEQARFTEVTPSPKLISADFDRWHHGRDSAPPLSP